MRRAGLFVTFEGGDGVGKTTQVESVLRRLISHGRNVLRTREPGGTELGLRIRELLLHTAGYIDPHAEALLFAADRAQHVRTTVIPALEAGTIVLQDRYIDSSVAYQGAGRELASVEIEHLSLWAAAGLKPDLTVLLDLGPDEAASRVRDGGKSADRMEAEAREFRIRLRNGFLDIARREPERFIIIDASLPESAITDLVFMEICRRLPSGDERLRDVLA